jgi:hypothetical protein
MRCLYCGARLPLLRELQNGDYCSDAHREAWERAQHECTFAEESRPAGLTSRHVPASSKTTRIRLYPLRHLVEASPGPRMLQADGAALLRPEVRSIRFKGEPAPWTPAIPAMAAPAFANWNLRQSAGKVLILSLLAGFLFLLRWGMPDLSASANLRPNLDTFDAGWADLRHSLLQRAAIDLNDDFRGGLDDWATRPGDPAWAYDGSGFAQPLHLALYRPSLDLTDYRLEFLGQLEKKGMGWAVRAADPENYEAVRLVVTKPGPLPLVDLVHYSVIGGKQMDRVEKPLPLTIRTDMMFRARMDVEGDDFTLIIQGQIVDFWSDGRLKRGGVGFFCRKGEVARLRWVEVSHHYDMLGRLCAYLTPYGMSSANGGWTR